VGIRSRSSGAARDPREAQGWPAPRGAAAGIAARLRCPLLEPAPDRIGDCGRRQLALRRHERRAVRVGLAGESRAHRLVVEQPRELLFQQRPLLLDHEQILAADWQNARARSGSSGHTNATL
jgi:hypothetical protein